MASCEPSNRRFRYIMSWLVLKIKIDTRVFISASLVCGGVERMFSDLISRFTKQQWRLNRCESVVSSERILEKLCFDSRLFVFPECRAFVPNLTLR